MKFGISNLRRLRETELVNIKPITLLVGRNSGGKSTFLRSFPLIRQSIQTRTSSPILWFGDLVDFGSLDDAISKDSDRNYIRFSFEDDVHISSRQRYYYNQAGEPIFHPAQRGVLSGLRYEVDVAPFQSKNRLSRIFIQAENIGNSIELLMSDNGLVEKVLIAGIDAQEYLGAQRIDIATDALFPLAKFVKRSSGKENSSPWYGFPGDDMSPTLFNFLRTRIDGRVRDQTLRALSDRIIISGLPTKRTVSRALTGQGKIVREKLNKILSSKGPDNSELMIILSIANIPSLLRDISDHFRRNLSATLYIGPARARSERYYRYQDLAVNEIDPDGKNFPMFLNSLTKSRQDSFSKWVESLYGYSVSVSQRSGHISITLTDRHVEANIVDVGYGISQVLPVLGQIWWAREKSSVRSDSTTIPILAIEQPELHLHPAHQAILADALAQSLRDPASKEDTSKIRFLIETHSEVLINRLGRMISDGEISSEDVQIILFEPADGGKHTKIRSAHYDKNGVLVDWPYGFFQPN